MGNWDAPWPDDIFVWRSFIPMEPGAYLGRLDLDQARANPRYTLTSDFGPSCGLYSPDVREGLESNLKSRLQRKCVSGFECERELGLPGYLRSCTPPPWRIR